MKEALKRPMSVKGDLDSETLKVIRSMAAALVQSAIKFTPAQKRRVLMEFSRVYDLMTKSLGTIYDGASRTKQRELEKEARKRGAQFRNRATAIVVNAICCVGHPQIDNQAECEGRHP